MIHTISIDSAFDGGNIRVVSASDPANIQLEIVNDAQSDFFQWFYFRVTGRAGQTLRVKLGNAGQAAYPRGWEDYQPVVSFDRCSWCRLPASYRDGVLEFDLTLANGTAWVAYFAPYSLQQHDDQIARASCSDRVEHQVLGHTIDGRPLDLLQIGDPQARLKLWTIARQHPGETMAQWWMDGFIDRLIDNNDAVSRALLASSVVYVVPNMNPDGSYRGHLRTNAVGVNLNREWQSPSIERSPEVYWIREKMLQTGVDCCIDVHGDEALPYNFIAGTQGIASWSDQKDQLLEHFKANLQQLNPDFQTTHGYPRPAAGAANYAICSNYVAEAFDCLAVTLEMPFKDTVDTPDVKFGWSPRRSINLGRSFIDAIYSIKNSLEA